MAALARQQGQDVCINASRSATRPEMQPSTWQPPWFGTIMPSRPQTGLRTFSWSHRRPWKGPFPQEQAVYAEFVIADGLARTPESDPQVDGVLGLAQGLRRHFGPLGELAEPAGKPGAGLPQQQLGTGPGRARAGAPVPVRRVGAVMFWQQHHELGPADGCRALNRAG